MAFILNDKTFRNLEEQVLKNKQDIAEHRNITAVLADLGIQVYGRLDTETELFDLPTDNLTYGDAYLIGTTEPYNVYIWTRANPDAGHDTPYWLNIGPISVQGPQGEPGAYISGAGLTQAGKLQMTLSNGQTILAQGPSLIGPQGEPGENGLTPTITTSASSAGTTITITTGTKTQTFFIQNGQPGERGLQGEPGKPGSFTIKGILNSVSLLPSASEGTPGDAYFIYDGVGQMPYNLFVLVTPDPTDTITYSWEEIGKLTDGCIVRVNGVIVDEFNADTKLNKVSDTYQYPRAYTINQAGQQQTTAMVGNATNQGTIVIRDTNGVIKAGYPSAYNDVATKQYVDYQISNLPTGGGGGGGRFLSENLYFQEGYGSELEQYSEFGALARAKIFWVQLNGFVNGPFTRDSEYNSATGTVIIPDQGSLNIGYITITGGSEGSSQYQISIQDTDGGTFFQSYQWYNNKLIGYTDEQ